MCTRKKKRDSNYIKQVLTALKGEIGKSEIIVGDFDPPIPSKVERTLRKKFRKDIKNI